MCGWLSGASGDGWCGGYIQTPIIYCAAYLNALIPTLFAGWVGGELDKRSAIGWVGG